MFNIVRYLRDRRIDFVSDGHGWVNLQCPMCRSAVYGSQPGKPYLGFNLEGGYLHCWRCGGHPAERLVMALEQSEWHEACRVVLEYTDEFSPRPPLGRARAAGNQGGRMSWPAGTVRMLGEHRAYLSSRGYDPEMLEERYGLMGTVGAGPYASRIMVPIFFRGEWVSYQGRDITGRSLLKYKACPKELEVMGHKSVLYNMDSCQGDSAVVVEGVFDVFRLGDGAVATFGTSVEQSQVALLASSLRRVFVLFDPEPEAQAKARRLCSQLSVLGCEASSVVLDSGDPGDMGEGEARRMMGELLG